ncbi:MAG: serine/threonine-protein kinase, partial [Opitutus sp.]
MKPEETIFADALALEPPQRVAFLTRACGADASLRQRVEDLLSGYEEGGDLLERLPVPEIDLARDDDDAEKEYAAGARIGRYRLLERIGEGGHGSVFVAEQETPVRRRVALKVIKLGMDTREVIARFEAERQALALMDHPNIARVLDAGATERGRPYFVMELVRGVPITRHCDEHKLDASERLKLFTVVCSAVQHAHQKGIIHRDLKPSNILVTLHDGVPVPKIIDFGIAKAMHGRLTDRTIYTRFEQFVGTPTYMSPEQLEMSGLDIDTRSDIYSLGVVLYELLTGYPPFESKELLRSGLEEMRRTIREIEPRRPSTRVSTLDATAGATVARQRATDPAKLRSWLRGDIDWIVMRCLEKDRRRRYETANALAMDLQHYLRDEPVTARPPSTIYTLRKFVRRHRVGVTAASAVVSVIVIGLIATTALTLRALRAERSQNELRAAAELAAKNEAAARRIAEEQQQHSAKVRWARETALPEINRLIQMDDIPAAFALARQAEGSIPEDPALLDLWLNIATDASIQTTPDGARVYAKPYQHPSADWEYIGTTPIAKVRLARAPYRYQIRKEGFETL